MIGANNHIFIEGRTDSGQRLLLPATVLNTGDQNYLAQLDIKPRKRFEANQAVLVYFEQNRKFLKQPALITSIGEDAEPLVLEFVLQGEPASAESREYYRVSAVMADIRIDIEKEAECKVLDVSVAGCSAECKGTYKLGDTVHIRLHHDGKTFDGDARVQGAKKLSGGSWRYGLLVIFDRDRDQSLKKALNSLTMYVQRVQLQRLAATR